MSARKPPVLDVRYLANLSIGTACVTVLKWKSATRKRCVLHAQLHPFRQGKFTMSTYDPQTFQALTFHTAREAFAAGTDTSRDYLERCIETIDAREPVVKALASINFESAREAADASTSRWKVSRPLSPIDGMPVGVKDLLETRDMPTEMNCEALKGNFPKRDNAAVWALRTAGAIPFGKTVTAELGGSHPGPTTNPFDPACTPGGSSSGSAAAVAACMMPAAIGSQVGGSIIRPASFCGNFALKPTQGAINRGERMATSMSTHGMHAGSIEDMWQASIEIASRAGGDRGCRALSGPSEAPAAQMPTRIAVLETEGWAILDDASRQAFEALIEGIAATGVEIVRRQDNRHLELLERTVSEAGRICLAITCWENRWYQRNIVMEKGVELSARAMATLERAEAMMPADYEAALTERAQAQLAHERLSSEVDATITLSSLGTAPLWPGDVPGQPLARRPTGDAIFNYATSMLFAPAVSVPMLAVGGMPVGVQFIGQQHEDARMTAFARWLHADVATISV
jgi:Asp-tRNA(Asn)/Glu-tRNA(Gln) amidotransferase A subunit family amidase